MTTTYRVTAVTLNVYADDAGPRRVRQAHLDIDPPIPVSKDGTLYAADRGLVTYHGGRFERASLHDDAAKQMVASDWEPPAAALTAAETAIADYIGWAEA